MWWNDSFMFTTWLLLTGSFMSLSESRKGHSGKDVKISSHSTLFMPKISFFFELLFHNLCTCSFFRTSYSFWSPHSHCDNLCFLVEKEGIRILTVNTLVDQNFEELFIWVAILCPNLYMMMNFYWLMMPKLLLKRIYPNSLNPLSSLI